MTKVKICVAALLIPSSSTTDAEWRYDKCLHPFLLHTGGVADVGQFHEDLFSLVSGALYVSSITNVILPWVSGASRSCQSA